MRNSLTLFLIAFAGTVSAQVCDLKLVGHIRDRSTGNGLSYATLKVIEDIEKSVITNGDGYFRIAGLCPGEYHIDVSYVGFETERKFLTLQTDTTLTWDMSYHDELLNEIVIHGEKEENTTQISTLVNQDKILQEANKNLADLIEGLSGVSVLKTGSGISKPIINGLYGNRITILNNGVAQAGQQWGNDHAPEIDPFVANHISVVKGTAALEYIGSSVGGIVRVEPDEISSDPHLHGNVNYIFQSNGIGHTLNSQVEKKGDWASWRWSGTLKRSGDLRAPDYFLTNTGKREGNIALQIEKSRGNSNYNLYFSSFNSEIGILRGAHVGNLTDLQDAIGRDTPFFTNKSFSYEINAPRQEVHHHLLKVRSQHNLDDNQRLEVTYAGQWNQRKEYDVRRSGRSDIPAMSLDLFSHILEGVYDRFYRNGSNLRTGLQLNAIDNTNNPETGILPLIPNYTSLRLGYFAIFQKTQKKLFYEFGGRYDLRTQQITSISRTSPRSIVRFNDTYHNFSFNSGFRYNFSSQFKGSFNIGMTERAPEVNELYSFGLHQGVSGIEEGDPDLTSERSMKGIVNFDWALNDQLFIQALGYLQRINDYIYLQPQNEFRLTIRGAFPVFIYDQTDARLAGSDWSLTYEPNPNTKISVIYAMVRGRDISNKTSLIYMPPDNVNTVFSWFVPDTKVFADNTLSLTGKYVWEQVRYEDEQDFLAPPDGYFLLGLNLGTHFALNTSTLHVKIRLENLLNTKYRDYLNRQRYFADEQGFNVNVGVNYSF